MKIVLVVFLCLFFSISASAQTETNNKNAEVTVEQILLARDDGKGDAGETAENFSVNDRPIYCIIQLDSQKPVAVKMIFVAAKAGKLKPETKIVTVNYTTKENENGVTFNASPNGVWAVGEYRVDIYLDNKLAKSKFFMIGKPPIIEASNEKSKTPKSFAPRKKAGKTGKN